MLRPSLRRQQRLCHMRAGALLCYMRITQQTDHCR